MPMRFLKVIAAATLSAGLLAAVAAPALAAGPAEQVKAREQLMKKMGGGMKAVADFLKGAGDAAGAQKGAAAIAEVAGHDVGDVFPKGTGIGVGESAAKPELWAHWDKTQALWGDLKPAAAQLVTAAGTGDKAVVGKAMQATGGACKNCHEEFRQKKD